MLYFARINKNNLSENELMDQGELCARKFFENHTPMGLAQRTEKTMNGW